GTGSGQTSGCRAVWGRGAGSKSGGGLPLDVAEIAHHAIPIEVALHRATPVLPDALPRRRVGEQAADRCREGGRLFGRDEEAGLAVADRIGNPTRVRGDDGQPAGRGFDQRDPDPLDAESLRATRRADVYRSEVVERRKILVVHRTEEPHGIPNPGLFRKPP